MAQQIPQEIPSKPYLVRALHEWCSDNGYTPYILVEVGSDTRVPHAYVHEGHITLNVSALATQHLIMDNETISFQARFGGVTEHVAVSMRAVQAIYARETGAGMGFRGMTLEAEDGSAELSAPDAASTPDAAQDDNPASLHPAAATAARTAPVNSGPDAVPSTQAPGTRPMGLVPATKPAEGTASAPHTEPPRRPKLTLVK